MTEVVDAFRDELRRIFRLRPVFSVLIGAVLIYAAFYPQPYLAEALRDVPIVVVDRDGTAASREMARRIDATSDARIVFATPDLPDAERRVMAREAHGIVLIPRDFERELLHGRPSPIVLYADASYFLLYQRVAGAVVAVARTMGAEVEGARLVGAGVDPSVAAAASDPMPLVAVPLFNPQGGYATYLLPAAFVLILQQTLLIGIGLLGTLPDAAPRHGVAATMAGRLLACFLIQAAIVPFYLVGLPWLYGVPRLGSLWGLLAMTVPFVLAVGGAGMLLAALIRNPLFLQLVMAAIGLIFFFLAGFAWPVEAMPQAVQWLAKLVPSTAAIDGFVRLSQMGAPLSSVSTQFLTLWVLALAYCAAAYGLLQRRERAAVAVGSPA